MPRTTTPDIALTPDQRAFKPIHDKGDIVAAVQLARRVMKEALLTGVGGAGVDYDPCELSELLAGEMDNRPGASITWEIHCERLYAAMVLGIALGQLVHSDVFTKGGAR